ncbi:MAG: hypothetical protein J1E95_04205 [Muribaculaceae bacterium]|nr:hypothetical protein [Muribaculaceae bacterium]
MADVFKVFQEVLKQCLTFGPSSGAPFKVNSAGLVENLNAKYLDGIGINWIFRYRGDLPRTIKSLAELRDEVGYFIFTYGNYENQNPLEDFPEGTMKYGIFINFGLGYYKCQIIIGAGNTPQSPHMIRFRLLGPDAPPSTPWYILNHQSSTQTQTLNSQNMQNIENQPSIMGERGGGVIFLPSKGAVTALLIRQKGGLHNGNENSDRIDQIPAAGFIACRSIDDLCRLIGKSEEDRTGKFNTAVFRSTESNSRLRYFRGNRVLSFALKQLHRQDPRRIQICYNSTFGVCSPKSQIGLRRLANPLSVEFITAIVSGKSGIVDCFQEVSPSIATRKEVVA